MNNENNSCKNNEINKMVFSQEPKQLFEYQEHDVSFENKKDTITLAGTLTVPQGEGPFPAVILIAGMGPHERDYLLYDHKRFLVIADYLTKRGFAVLRYDKRGIGKSTGIYNLQITTHDFAQDVLAGIDFLKSCKEIDSDNIGLLGHSEGGIVAPIAAQHTDDVAFMVLLAGVSTTSIDDLIDQIKQQQQVDGASADLIESDAQIRKQLLEIVFHEPDFILAEKQLCDAINEYLENMDPELRTESEQFHFVISASNALQTIQMINSPWYRNCLTMKPEEILQKVTMPVLALYGGHDFIVSSKKAVPLVQRLFTKAGNTDVTVYELPNLNHSMQTCKTGSFAEFETIKEAISPKVLSIIFEWLTKRIT